VAPFRWDIEKRLLTTSNLSLEVQRVAEENSLSAKQVKKHLPHLAKEMVAPSSPEYSKKIVGAVEDLLTQAQEIVDLSKGEGLYKTALDGLKTMGTLLTTQAKLLGHLDTTNNTTNVSVVMSPKDVAKLAEDYQNTVEAEVVQEAE